MRSHFVCVRITRMNGVDLSRFEFDYDTTWTAFFLDENLNVYSRYGGRDEGEPDDRLSKQALLQTMREVLNVHKSSKLGTSKKASAFLQPVDQDADRPESIPLLKKHHRGCVHCHQIREYRFLQWANDGVFDRRKLFGFPFPENIGVRLDRKHGHRIERILPASAALGSDLRPGDVIDRVGDVPIHSELDVRWALHRVPNNTPISISVSRPRVDSLASDLIHVTLKPKGDWWVTDLSWRKSQRSVPLPFGLRGYALTPSQLQEFGFSEDQLAIRVISVQKGLGRSLGLLKRDVIVAVAAAGSKKRTFEQFKSDLLCRYKPGDMVRLTVIREGRSLEVKSAFPEWHTDETTVP